ncbi:MAG: tetratricopeptide repeat protein [Nanoarchaeota archaeon]|mgnify:CR=1 FL=1
MIQDSKNDLDQLVTRLEHKEKKRARLYVGVLVTLTSVGLALVFWSTRQSEKLTSQTDTLVSLKDSVATQNALLDSLNQRAARVEQAREQIDIGVANASRGRFTAALKSYDRAISLDPQNSGAYALKGYLLLRKGENKLALDYLTRAVEMGPDMLWHRYNLALALWANGRNDDAVQEVSIIVKTNPDFREIILKDVQFKVFRASKEFRTITGLK